MHNDISEWFWRIIDDSNADRQQLQLLLEQMSEGDIVRFRDEFISAATELTDPPYINYMGPEISEDTIMDVAECIVSQGKTYYSNVWNHPEVTPNYVECKSMTSFSGVAGRVFLDRFGRSIHG